MLPLCTLQSGLNNGIVTWSTYFKYVWFGIFDVKQAKRDVIFVECNVHY